MNTRIIRILAPVVIAFCVSACMIEINYELPRWKCTLQSNGKTEKVNCVKDTYPGSIEYSVPEFFIRDNGEVVFRFFDKTSGLKLQGASATPFEYDKQYNFSRGDEYFDVSFDWLYDGKDFNCVSGWMTFKRHSGSNVAYSINFEFDLAASDGSKIEIRKGVFTTYKRVSPRNTDLGLH